MPRKIKPTYKKTGEAAMFNDIWNQRPHYCEHCNIHLGDSPRAHFFSHIKSKGAHPEARLDPDNIQLLCFVCHQVYDNGG